MLTSIRGFLWNDLNGNGSHDNGEAYRSGWTVALSSGKSVTTDVNGHYKFTNLPKGNYKVAVETRTGVVYTTSQSVVRTIDDINIPTAQIPTVANFGIKDKYCPNLICNVAVSGSDTTGDGSHANPFATIQHGIDVAKAGYTVLVHSGTYVENINFNGKNITVKSTDGAEKTIIDGNQNGSVVKFVNGENAQAVLNGFTLTNGNGNYMDIRGDLGYGRQGGGIYTDKSNPTVMNLKIVRNKADFGAGIASYVSGPMIFNSLISDNTATTWGGGIYYSHSTYTDLEKNLVLENTVISKNKASGGAGITVNYGSQPILTNVTITENIHSDNPNRLKNAGNNGGAIWRGNASGVTMSNSIVWNNSSTQIYWAGGTSWTSQISNSDIQGGETGRLITWGNDNLDTDPLFENGYHLSSNSPAIGAGTSTGAPNTDLDGNPRPNPTGSNPDIGAYENPLGTLKFDLTVRKARNGTISANGINCGSDCSESYVANTQVTLTASPANGFVFANWLGTCTGTNPTVTVTMDTNKICVANFVPITFNLSVSKTGNGTVTSDPAGIDCGSDCDENYASGEAVTLTATSATGSIFKEWGGACSGTTLACQVNMSQAQNVRAIFIVSINGDVSVEILPTDSTTPVFQASKVVEIVKRELLLPSKSPYLKVLVRVVNSYAKDAPLELIVYLLRKDIYQYETVKITLNTADYSVISLVRDYQEVANDFEPKTWGSYACPDPTVDMVFATPCASGGSCGYIPTAVNAINYVHNKANNAGYNVVKLLGNQATTTAYKNWLSCDLKAFGNIGHGSPSGIMLHDGTLSHTWFASLQPTEQKCNVMYFNSCKVHNSPLEPSIMGAGSRVFVGGDTNLYIGPSEEVFKHFWENVLLNSQGIGPILDQWESWVNTNVGYTGTHGFSGDQGILEYDLTTTKIGNGTVTSSTLAGCGLSINCGANCSRAYYQTGVNVQLTATPDPGYVFQQWSGNCSGTNSSTTVTMDTAKTCIAKFVTTDCPQPATIESVKSGDWYNKSTWNQNYYPKSTDVVLVKEGHTVTGKYSGYPYVEGICNNGTIRSGSKLVVTGSHCNWYWTTKKVCIKIGWWSICYWVPVLKCNRVNDYSIHSRLNLTASKFLNNYGQIRRAYFSANDRLRLNVKKKVGWWWFHYLPSGPFNNYPGATVSGGNSVSISAKQITNFGAYSSGDVAKITGKSVYALATNDFSNKGKISGSGTVKVSGSPFYNDGIISGSPVYLDPQLLSLLEGSKVEAEEVIIVGGDDALLDLGNLKEGAIIAEKLTIVVGKGGTIDLTGIPANALQATEVEIFADNIVLDEGKQLANVINTENVIVKPAKILYNVSIMSPGDLAGKTGEELPVNIVVANAGPTVDTYTINITSKQGWNLSTIPSTLTVETHKQGGLEFNVTLPVIDENEQTENEDTITMTVTSQSDPTVSDSIEIKIIVAKQIFETITDEHTGKLVVEDDAGNKIDMEEFIEENTIKEKGEIPNFSGTLEDENGQPMVNATVQIGDKVVTTDANGYWEIPPMSKGNHTITISQDGNVLVSEEIVVGDDGAVIESEPVEENNYKASGTLLDKEGNPIAGVTIQIGDKTALTDATGNWEITGLPEGDDYIVTASKDGYIFGSKDFAVGNDQNASISFKADSVLDVKVIPDPRTAQQGENITYTITVTNNGSETATGVVLTDTLPTDTSLLSIEALDGGNCSAETVICTLSDLTPGATATVKLVISNTQADRLLNTAKVTANNYPADVQITRTKVIPYLSVSLSDMPDPVTMGGTLHYTVEVELSQFAPTDATGVELVMRLPSGVELENATTDYGTCDTSDLPTVTCTINDLSIASAEATSHITVNLDVKLTDMGLLLLTHDAKVTSNEYPAHSVKERTKVFIGDIKVDMVFVVDTTNSMAAEINGVIAALKKFIKEIEPSKAPLIVLVEFKDDVWLKAATRDLNVLLGAVENLKAEGGGTCPEASVEALTLAIEHLKDGGVILFTTDASPYADADLEKLGKLVSDKDMNLITILTGDCSNRDSWNVLP
jgi:uncharacterized repeat protein (TIGR01451 family)